ncbi:hypothetical protein [Sinorhizobium meliloti]|uniref:hypothetical protein n=1 Tax=Rhizobium meliloti TaxID=382 RepID=UPI00115F78CC|nr:hypothetical protein [Sinorhizobium meliloti]MDE4586503.1 hypothetical protein [Sinorhizobium meliloti]
MLYTTVKVAGADYPLWWCRDARSRMTIVNNEALAHCWSLDTPVPIEKQLPPVGVTVFQVQRHTHE